MLKLIALMSFIGFIAFHAANLLLPAGAVIAFEMTHEWLTFAAFVNRFVFVFLVVPSVLKS